MRSARGMSHMIRNTLCDQRPKVKKLNRTQGGSETQCSSHPPPSTTVCKPHRHRWQDPVFLPLKHSEVVVYPCARIRCNTASLCPLTSCPQWQHLLSCSVAHSQNGEKDTVQTWALCTQVLLPLSPWPPLICSLRGAHTRHIAGSPWAALSLSLIPRRDVGLLYQHSLLLIVRGCGLSSLCDQTFTEAHPGHSSFWLLQLELP